jgi:phage tail-like protein
VATSSYLQYLPPVLWTPDNDPPASLGHHLRIYEKILTGLSAGGLVTRASAQFVSAQLDAILLVDEADASRFAAGDWITIAGTGERRQVDHFTGATIALDANLVGVYPLGGTVRIADLAVGQMTFRADNATRVEAGYPLRILQAGGTEDLLVASTSGSFIDLKFGLTQTYSLDLNAVPVKLIDVVAVEHNGKVIADLEAQIDDLFGTFNPWRAQSEFLPWLASWVALTLHPDWSEYQKRKLISQMAGIYQQRGLKQGIYTYLDIYAVAAAQPRVVVDDGEAMFHPRFAADRTAALAAFAHSNTASPVSDPTKTVSVLVHPSGVGVDSANRYFVCDPADMELAVPRRPALWRVSWTGEVDFGPVVGLPMPMPTPLFSGNPFHLPCAITVDATDRVAILDTGNITSATMHPGAIFRFTPPAYPIATVIDEFSAPAFPAIHPVDMALDGAGNFVVLDRGRHPLGNPPAGSSNPRIVVVSEGPLAVALHPLAAVKEPTCILAAPLGKFLITDARDQATTTPADILSVDPGAGFATTSLLGGMAPGTNPLVFPTGMVWEAPGVLLVADRGLRWGFVIDPGNRTMAEPPHLYRVDLTQAPPVVTRVTTQRQLVHPTKLAWDKKNRLLITDRGETMDDIPQRNWRAGSNEFGVTVFFSNQRPTTSAERNAYRRGVVRVIESELVGHASWWMDF